MLEKYNRAISEWQKHIESVIHSSRAQDYLECDAFRSLSSMGKEILPLVLQTMQKSPGNIHGLEWAALIHNLVPEFKIPEDIRGKVKEIFKYTQQFVEAQLIREKFIASLSMPIDAGRKAVEEANKTIEKYKHLLEDTNDTK